MCRVSIAFSFISFQQSVSSAATALASAVLPRQSVKHLESTPTTAAICLAFTSLRAWEGKEVARVPEVQEHHKESGKREHHHWKEMPKYELFVVFVGKEGERDSPRIKGVNTASGSIGEILSTTTPPRTWSV